VKPPAESGRLPFGSRQEADQVRKSDLKTEIELLWLRKRELDAKEAAHNKAWADEGDLQTHR
jgi:hypothetical protein